jgi:hypothetical protein
MLLYIFPAVPSIEVVGFVVVRKALQRSSSYCAKSAAAVLQESGPEAASVQALVDHQQINHMASTNRVT